MTKAAAMSRIRPVAVRRTAVVAVFMAVSASPGAAWACPACATREGAGATVFALIGLMIAVPYVIAVITIRVMRRLERES